MQQAVDNASAKPQMRHPLFGHEPAKRRLKSRKGFLNSVEPNGTESTRVALWEETIANLPTTALSISAKEELPPSADSSWAEWKCLNRLRSNTGRCKVTLKKWGYPDTEDVTCECEPQNMKRLLRCPLLEHECDAKDLAEFNDSTKDSVQLWLKHYI